MADFDFLTASGDEIAARFVAEASAASPDAAKNAAGIGMLTSIAKPYIVSYRNANKDKLMSGAMTQDQFIQGMAIEVHDKLKNDPLTLGVVALAAGPAVRNLQVPPSRETILLQATGVDDKGVVHPEITGFKVTQTLVEQSPALKARTQAQAQNTPPSTSSQPPETKPNSPSALSRLNPISTARGETVPNQPQTPPPAADATITPPNNGQAAGAAAGTGADIVPNTSTATNPTPATPPSQSPTPPPIVPSTETQPASPPAEKPVAPPAPPPPAPSISFSSGFDAFTKMGDKELPIALLMAQGPGVTHDAAAGLMGMMKSNTLSRILLFPEDQTLSSPGELTQTVAGLFAHGIAEKTGTITKDANSNDVIPTEEKLAGTIAAERLRSWIDEAKTRGRIKPNMSAEDIHTLSADAAKAVHAALVARKSELGALGGNGAKGWMGKLGAMVGLSDDPIDMFCGGDENGNDPKNKYRYRGNNIQSLTEAMLVSAQGSEPAQTAFKTAAKKQEREDLANGVNTASLLPGQVHRHARDRSAAIGGPMMTPAEEAAITKISQRIYGGEDVDTEDPEGKNKEPGFFSNLGKLWDKICVFFTALMNWFSKGGNFSDLWQQAENGQHYKNTRDSMLNMQPRELGYRGTERIEELTRQWKEVVRTEPDGEKSAKAMAIVNAPEMIDFRKWRYEMVNKLFPEGGKLETGEPASENEQHGALDKPKTQAAVTPRIPPQARQAARESGLNQTGATGGHEANGSQFASVAGQAFGSIDGTNRIILT